MRTVCIIPARGGSKGIPRKNLQEIGGGSLLYWAVITAKKSSLIDGIFVSTEDDEIAEMAMMYGANVINRPAELAADGTPSAPVIWHAVQQMERPERYILVQATAYPQSVDTMDHVIQAMSTFDADTAISVRRDTLFLFRRGKCGYGYKINQHSQMPRQLSEPEYLQTGACVAGTVDFLQKTGELIGGRIALVEDSSTVVDIDTPQDLEIARALHAYRNN